MGLTSGLFAVALDMRSRNRAVLRGLGAGAALFLAVPALATAEILPEPIEGLTQRTAAPRPSTTVPAPPATLPDVIPPRFSAGYGTLAAVRPVLGDRTLSFSSGFGPGSLVAPRQAGFSGRLMSRMSREAQRFRRDNVSDAWGAFRSGRDDELDSIALARRSAEASRVVTRSVHRALNDELDRVARTSLGLGPALDWLQSLSLPHVRSGRADRPAGPAGPAPSPSPAARPDGLRGDIGLRLDAHPALLIRARFRCLRGRIELPARGDALRLSLESSLGSRGRAVFTSGLPRDGQGWATLTFNFGF